MGKFKGIGTFLWGGIEMRLWGDVEDYNGLTDISQYKYDVFLICPVRNATESQKERMMEYIENLENNGTTVYYPARDTDQNDNIGFRICSDNKYAMKNSKEVHIFWDKNSQGSLFDLGMAFALEKEITVVNLEELENTDHKSFSNMIRKWSKM